VTTASAATTTSPHAQSAATEPSTTSTSVANISVKPQAQSSAPAKEAGPSALAKWTSSVDLKPLTTRSLGTTANAATNDLDTASSNLRDQVSAAQVIARAAYGTVADASNMQASKLSLIA
jgi:hypothetical protein